MAQEWLKVASDTPAKQAETNLRNSGALVIRSLRLWRFRGQLHCTCRHARCSGLLLFSESVRAINCSDCANCSEVVVRLLFWPPPCSNCRCFPIPMSLSSFLLVLPGSILLFPGDTLGLHNRLAIIISLVASPSRKNTWVRT